LREKVGCKLNADVGFFVKVNQVEINVSILSRNESLIFNFVGPKEACEELMRIDTKLAEF